MARKHRHAGWSGRGWLIGGILASMLIGLTGCASSRPKGSTCIDQERTAQVVTRAVSPETDDAFGDFRNDIEIILRARKGEVVERGLPGEVAAPPLRILALSAGGQWGAFGSGFLKGWSSQEAGARERPEFDLVTGVSTGALMATFAFLGRDYDALLEQEYTSVSSNDLAKRRFALNIPFSNSFYKTDRLRERIASSIDEALLDEVAREWEERGRGLFVAATNLDTGALTLFNLTALAADRNNPHRVQDYIDRVMASAAIPIAFPPVFIDGEMHVDGGARQHVFVAEIDRAAQAYARGIGRATAPDTELYMIINGDLRIVPMCTQNGLLGVAGRTSTVVIDQLLLSSAYRLANEGEKRGWRVRYVSAEGHPCGNGDQSDELFDTQFMRCLFDYGYERGSGTADPWKAGVPGASDEGV